MAKFPRREADVAALAGTMVFGLAENAEDFPDCPVSVERLQEALARYNRAKETAATAEGAPADYLVPVDLVEALSGLDFFSALPDSLADLLEEQTATTWPAVVGTNP